MGMASQFFRALSDTDGVLHGDPHTRNVIVQLEYDRPWLTLIDFGTSRFTRSDKFVERHWRVVGETISRIFHNSPRYKRAKDIVGKMPISKRTDSDSRRTYYTLLVSWADPDEERDDDGWD